MKKIALLFAIPLLAASCASKPESNSPESVSVVERSQWKMYDSRTSPEFKDMREPFTFKYPPNWFVASEGRGVIELISFIPAELGNLFPLPANQFRVSIAPELETNDGEDVSVWCKKKLTEVRYNHLATIQIEREEKTIVGDTPAYVIDSRAKYTVDGKVVDDTNWRGDRQVCVAKGDARIILDGSPLDDSEHLPMFDQVIATFMFVK